MRLNRIRAFINLACLLALLGISVSTSAQPPLYSGVLISNVGTLNSIGHANTSRNLTVGSDGTIYAVFFGSQGVRVAKSVNRGQSFLPSVQVSPAILSITDASTSKEEAEIEISSNGTVYVAWNQGLTMYLSYSTDGAATFSAPAVVGTPPSSNTATPAGNIPHIACYGSNVYVLPQSSKLLYFNSNNGVGAFSSTPVGTSHQWYFSDVRVDKNGDVYVVVDNPTVFLYRSTDNGASFSEVVLFPRPTVSYSSYCLIAGSFGSYIFTGGSGNLGNRLNCFDGVTNSVSLQSNNQAFGRSLLADEFGNVVDGCNLSTNSLGIRVSHDQGTTWGPAIAVPTGETSNIFRNHKYQDVLVAYQNGGQVYLAVYENLLLGLTNTTPALNDCAGKAINVTYTALGPFLAGNTFTAQLSDAAGSFASAVNIGSVTSTTSGTISATIPANTPGGTGYRIRVVSSTPVLFGTDNGSNLTVSPNPGSNYTLTSPQCAGTDIVFTNTSTLTPSTLTIAWDFDDGQTSTAVSPTHAFAVGTYQVKLTSTTPAGCTDNKVQTITVSPKPVPSFTINGAVQCLATNLFEFTNTTPPAAGMTYLWRFGDGATASTQHGSHSYATVGTYHVKLIVTGGGGCKDSIEHDVAVGTSTNPAFTINTQAQCLSGNLFTFTNASPSGSTYEWFFGDGGTSTATSPTHTYALTNSYDVKLIATATGGCKDSVTHSVLVHPSPASSYTINATVQCQKDNSFAFTNTSSGATSYLYRFGDGQTATSPTATHTYALPGNYQTKLVVSNTDGCLDSIPQTVTVKPTAIPGFTVNGTAHCLVNNAVVFTNTSTTQAGTMSYLWKFGDASTSTAQHPTHSYAATGTYLVKLFVSVNGDCLDSAEQTITVNPTPAVSFTSPSLTAQCLNGNSYSFNNTAGIAGGAPLTYLWKFDDGGTAATTNASHVYTVFGTYLVKLYATAPTGCIDSASATVIVHPKPNVDFANDNPDQCLPTNHFTFTNKTTLGLGTMSQVWTYGDGGQTTGVNGDHTYAIFGNYFVKLVVTSDKGCTDFQQQPIGFLPKPVPAFAINTDGQCLTGNAFTFTSSSSITAGTYSTEWWYGDGATALTQHGNHSYAAANPYVVALILVSDRGCTDTLRKTVTIHPMPTAGFTVNNAAQCANTDDFQFTNTSAIAGGTLSYTWLFGDGQTSTLQHPSHSYALSNPYNVQLAVTSDKGCGANFAGSVEALPVPGLASFTTNDIDQCLLVNDFTFTNTSPVTGGPLTYTWVYGDGSTGTTTDGTRVYAAPGQYKVQLVSANPQGCLSDTGETFVNVYLEPTVKLGADRIVLENLAITLDPKVTGNNLTYLWTPDRYLANNTTLNPTVSPLDDVTYTLAVTGPGGCTAFDEISLTILKALVVPNAFSPNGDGVNDRWTIPHLDIYPGCVVEVFNRSGQSVYRATNYTKPWDGTYRGALLPVGTYYYVIDPKNGRAKMSGSVTILR
jgi:gliding motility-associated-like protein